MTRPKDSKRQTINVIVDTREQKGWFDAFAEVEDNYFDFSPERGTLKTGDYSIKGLEDIFVIERKASTSELSRNIMEPRFEEEFKRLECFKYKFVICEFDFRDIVQFPVNSGIPKHLQKSIKISGKFLLKKIVDLEMNYGVNFIYAGENAIDVAVALMKRANKELNG